MKAIQIKYLTCTKLKPSRLKCWAEGCKPIVEPTNSNMDMDAQALHLAKLYAIKMDWGMLSGFGCICDGSYVATLEKN